MVNLIISTSALARFPDFFGRNKGRSRTRGGFGLLKTVTFSNTLPGIGVEVDSGEGGERSVNRRGMADYATTGGFERGEEETLGLGG